MHAVTVDTANQMSADSISWLLISKNGVGVLKMLSILSNIQSILIDNNIVLNFQHNIIL